MINKMANLMLFGRLADARGARLRHYWLCNAHLDEYLSENDVKSRFRFGRDSMGTFHLVKNSENSSSGLNEKRFLGSPDWKIPRKSGTAQKVVPFSRLERPVIFTSSRSTVIFTAILQTKWRQR